MDVCVVFFFVFHKGDIFVCAMEFLYYPVTFWDLDLINGWLIEFKTRNDSTQVNKHEYLFAQHRFLCVYCKLTNHTFLLHEKSAICNACDKPLDITKRKIKENFHRLYFIMLLFLPTEVCFCGILFMFINLFGTPLKCPYWKQEWWGSLYAFRCRSEVRTELVFPLGSYDGLLMGLLSFVNTQLWQIWVWLV